MNRLLTKLGIQPLHVPLVDRPIEFFTTADGWERASAGGKHRPTFVRVDMQTGVWQIRWERPSRPSGLAGDSKRDRYLTAFLGTMNPPRHSLRRAMWRFLLLLVPLGSAAAKGSSSPLMQALDATLVEAEARKVLEPHMAAIKSLETEVIELVVMRQWWSLARELVAKSHEQKVDLSFSVRKAVRSLKDEADELLLTLDPKYGQVQQVSPSFQWAQNDTAIFLSVKYTVRWNAPGALEVTDPSVNMTGNVFNFSGLGKHSNNKYKYFLSVNLFDNIDAQLSSWSAASVGKLSVTLRKRWPRKWPRLLVDKKTKIGNMHLWMEMQEKLDSSLSGLSSVTNSPVSCGQMGKLYCMATDTCKKSDACTQCPGKSEPDEKANLCAGKPTEKASLSFQDADMDENQLSGEVKIHKARNDFDVDTYAVFWGKAQDLDQRTQMPSFERAASSL
ncbi:unnamed protein product [Symbiodinium necroappetens]|nr:unnamed protein product [Symbiodinium necroappetens]